MLCNLVWRFGIIWDFDNVGLIIGIIPYDVPHTSSRGLIFYLWLHLYCILHRLRSFLIIFLKHSGGLGWRSIYNIYITYSQGTILLYRVSALFLWRKLCRNVDIVPNVWHALWYALLEITLTKRLFHFRFLTIHLIHTVLLLNHGWSEIWLLSTVYKHLTFPLLQLGLRVRLLITTPCMSWDPLVLILLILYILLRMKLILYWISIS